MAAPAAQAGERSSDEKRIEKRVVIRHGGGGFLGVGLDDVEGEARGAKVGSVRTESPAAKAGIKEGDVVVRFDGEGVRSAAQLVRLVGETPAGRSVAVEVLRAGKAEKLTVTLGEGDRLFQHAGEPATRELRFKLPVPPVPPDVSVEDGYLQPHQAPAAPPGRRVHRDQRAARRRLPAGERRGRPGRLGSGGQRRGQGGGQGRQT